MRFRIRNKQQPFSIIVRLLFTMYVRLSRQFHKKFISLNSSRNAYSSITPCYRQPSGVISNHLTVTRNLHFTYIFRRETDTVAMCEGRNRRVLNVDYRQLLEAQKDDNVLIIDVREQSEINETGKLPGSIHIPMGDVSDILLNLSEEEFQKRYGKCKPVKHTKIIFSCRSGKRSGMVQEAIQKLGYENIYNYTGGWIEWESKQKV